MLARIRKQPEYRLAASHGGGQAEVEQRSAARDMQRTAIRITTSEHPRRIGVQVNRLARRLEPEAPRLRVMHRGSPGRRSHQVNHCPPGQVPRGTAFGRTHRVPSHEITSVGLIMCCPAVARQRAGGAVAAAHLSFLLSILSLAAVAGLI